MAGSKKTPLTREERFRNSGASAFLFIGAAMMLWAGNALVFIFPIMTSPPLGLAVLIVQGVSALAATAAIWFLARRSAEKFSSKKEQDKQYGAILRGVVLLFTLGLMISLAAYGALPHVMSMGILAGLCGIPALLAIAGVFIGPVLQRLFEAHYPSKTGGPTTTAPFWIFMAWFSLNVATALLSLLIPSAVFVPISATLIALNVGAGLALMFLHIHRNKIPGRRDEDTTSAALPPAALPVGRAVDDAAGTSPGAAAEPDDTLRRPLLPAAATPAADDSAAAANAASESRAPISLVV